MRPTWSWWFGLGAVLGGLLVYALFRGKAPDPVLLHTVDSVLADSSHFKITRDSLAKVARMAANRARIAQAASSATARWADSVARAAPTNSPGVDSSLVVPRVAYDSLHAAYDRLGGAFVAQQRSIVALKATVAADSSRIETLQGTLAILRTAYAHTRTRRCIIGAGPGVGIVYASGTIHAGPSLSLNLACKI